MALAACDAPTVSSQSQNEAKYRTLTSVAGSKNIVIGAQPTGPDARATVREFLRQNEYHGAVAVAANADVASWWVGMSSVENAKKAAVAECNFFSRSTSCTVHAVSVPVTKSGQQIVGVGHSAKAVETLKEMYVETDPGRFSALAETEFGVWFASWNYATAADARKNALDGCNDTNAEVRAETDPGLMRELATVLDMTCKITITFAP